VALAIAGVRKASTDEIRDETGMTARLGGSI